MDDPIKEFEEMYLKKLYEFYAEDPQKPIRNSRIAAEMGVSQASSSEMIQRLAGKGILYHIPYRGSTLTEQGLAAAASIKRRECLMEVFLIRMIDYKGDVKAAACRLEHALTDDLESAIDRLLGYPETTPDGEIIPAISRHIEPVTNSMLLPLHALPEGRSGEVELMILEGTDIRTVSCLGVTVGSVIQSTDVGFSINGKVMVIAPELASQILIRTL
ncbi:MAG: metal-dependent transcriptional regulator [Candidatus Poseidoniales archaeon]|nr:metal-dependent transcriptional regulator [Candidatus Poseidoniales archaeon]